MIQTHKVTFSNNTQKYYDWLDNADRYAKENNLYIVDVEVSVVENWNSIED